MTLNRKQQGFTIVELLIVIVVIGILAALVITTFTGINKKARDTERTTDLKALHGQLEAYYAQNGMYPTLANMQDDSWIGTNLKGLDAEAAHTPQGDAGNNISATASAKLYQYTVTADPSGACDNTATNCGKYTLTANLEGSTTPYTQKSLN